jgi:hypothetical protein
MLHDQTQNEVMSYLHTKTSSEVLPCLHKDHPSQQIPSGEGSLEYQSGTSTGLSKHST